MKSKKNKKWKKPSEETIRRANSYGWIIKGGYYTLSEMDRGQLMEALMDTVDALERIEHNIANIHTQIAAANGSLDTWHDGEPGRWDT